MAEIITHSVIKLIQHSEICSGEVHPVSAQIDITTFCNLDCVFCTAVNDRTSPKSVDVLEFEKILVGLKDIGCKGIELTGGGDPLMHKSFEKIVGTIKTVGFDIGLITNGALIHTKDPSVWSKFDWIRVSVNAGPSEYYKIHKRDVFDKVLGGLKVLDKYSNFYGASYVYTGQDFTDIRELIDVLSSNLVNIKYLRVARDVLKSHDDFDVLFLPVVEYAANVGLKLDYQVSRDMWVPKKCIMYKLKPRIDVTGNVYPCCVAQYNNIHNIGSFAKYKDIIDKKFDVDIDTSKCPYCIYGEINNFALKLDGVQVKNKNFI